MKAIQCTQWLHIECQSPRNYWHSLAPVNVSTECWACRTILVFHLLSATMFCTSLKTASEMLLSPSSSASSQNIQILLLNTKEKLTTNAASCMPVTPKLRNTQPQIVPCIQSHAKWFRITSIIFIKMNTCQLKFIKQLSWVPLQSFYAFLVKFYVSSRL